MNNQNKLLWKLMVLMCSALLVSACLTDDDDDGDGDNQSSDEVIQALVGIWVGECEVNPDAGSQSFKSSQTQLEFMPDGSAINSGVEYSDLGCNTEFDQYGPNEATITIGSAFNTGDGGFDGYEFDFDTGKEVKYQIITEVIEDPDNGDEFFFLGLETETLDGSSPQKRPDTFDEDTRFYKSSVGITSFE